MNFEEDACSTTLVFNGDTEGMQAMHKQLADIILSDQLIPVAGFPNKKRIWGTPELVERSDLRPENVSPVRAQVHGQTNINRLSDVIFILVTDSDGPVIAPFSSAGKVYVYVNILGIRKLSELCNECIQRSHWIYVTYPNFLFKQAVGALPYALRWPHSQPISGKPFAAIEFIRTDADKSVWFHFNSEIVTGSPLGYIWFAQRLWDFAESGNDSLDFDDTPCNSTELSPYLSWREDRQLLQTIDGEMSYIYPNSQENAWPGYVDIFHPGICKSFKFRKIMFSSPVYSIEKREGEDSQYIWGNEEGFKKLAEFFVDYAYTHLSSNDVIFERNAFRLRTQSGYFCPSNSSEYIHFLGAGPWSLLQFGGSQFSKITGLQVIGGLQTSKLYGSYPMGQDFIDNRMLKCVNFYDVSR